MKRYGRGPHIGAAFVGDMPHTAISKKLFGMRSHSYKIKHLCISLFFALASLHATGVESDDGYIKDLISRLAISEQPAGMSPIFTPSIDTPKTDKRVIAYDAVKQLLALGVKAFPALIASIDDHRQSIALRAMIPHDVGLACFCIIQEQVEDFPSTYRFERTGALFKKCNQPEALSRSTIKEWWSVRAGRPLLALQIEALEWTIAQEKQIGFVSQKQKTEILTPLETRLKELKTAEAEPVSTPAISPDKALRNTQHD